MVKLNYLFCSWQISVWQFLWLASQWQISGERDFQSVVTQTNPSYMPNGTDSLVLPRGWRITQF